ncbi:hypothetical protein [Roseateles sp.]|uniref:hypothetical protein n=1 Tax=Roseateles sp. TaxID=1971397 RepID=UPI003BAD4EFD
MFKALLTAGAVLLVMVAARHGGRRFAGVVAALPTITAPTLAWLADEEGTAFAISAAVGSVAACAMLAAFALGYARAARHGGSAVALVCGLGAALGMAVPAGVASADLTCALALAVGCCALAFAAMPKPRADVVATARSSRSMWLVAAAAGVLTAIAASVGPAMGGFATGLLSSIPLVTGSVAMVEHASSGHRAAANFLRGYVGGLFGKAAFGTVFALLAPRIGAVAALSLACACACLVSATRWRALPVGASALTARPSRVPE